MWADAPSAPKSVTASALPPSAAPRRRAPPQGRLCGRSSARSAALVAVLAGAPVSVARPRPRPKGTTAPGKPAPCVSRASPDPGHRPSTRRTVRPRRGPGAGGTRRQPSPARPAVVAYGISPRSRCGLPEPRQRGRPVHNPEPDMAGFTPKRSGPTRPRPAFSTGRFRCYTANQVDSFVGPAARRDTVFVFDRGPRQPAARRDPLIRSVPGLTESEARPPLHVDQPRTRFRAPSTLPKPDSG